MKPIKVYGLKVNETPITSFIPFKRTTIRVNPTNLNTSWIMFALDDTIKKYGLSQKVLLTLLYLYEMGSFKIIHNIRGKKYHVSHLVRMGYIVLDYILNNNKYYKLTNKAVVVVRHFNKRLESISLEYKKDNKTNVMPDGSKNVDYDFLNDLF